MGREETISINYETIIRYAPHAIILVSTLIGLYILSPIYASGNIMNIDLPMHLGRAACFEKNPMWSLPTMWCPYGQAGIASFQAYPLMPFHLVSVFNWFLPLTTAFKLMLVVVFFLLPAGAFFLLHRLGYTLAGSIAFLLLVVQHGSWHSGGFDKIFYVGLLANAMGSGMFLFSLAFAIQFFEKPTHRNLAFVSIVSAAFFLSHAATFMFLPPCLLILAWMYQDTVRKHLKMFIAYPIIVFLLVSYWLVPFVLKSDYYVSSGSGNVKLAEIKDYLLRDLSWTVLLLGFAGVCYGLLRGDRRLRTVSICALLIPLLWIIGFAWPTFPYFNLIQMIRNLGEARAFILVFVSLILGVLAKMHVRAGKVRIPLAILTVALLVFTAPSMIEQSEQSGARIVSDTSPEFAQLRVIYQRLSGAQGRVLVEDTLFFAGQTALSVSHPWSISALHTDLELLGTGDNLYNKNDYSNSQQNILFNRPIESWTPKELSDMFTQLNVEYIVAYAPPYLNTFQNYTVAFAEQPWIVFTTGIKPSYFMIANGTVSNERYDKWSASADVFVDSVSELVYKVRQFPNWKALIDGSPVTTSKNEWGTTIIPIPAGSHRIDIKYGYVLVDIIGHILTAVGIVVIAYLWMRPHHQRDL